MKKNIFSLLCLMLILLASCKKEEPPTIETTSPTSITASIKGESKSVSFTCNKPWSAESDESWCTVSPASGEAGTNTVSISIIANDTYSARSNIVTIYVEDIFLEFSIVQSENKGAFASNKVYNIDASEQTLSIEINSNITYESKVSADWITPSVESKALEKSYLDFLIDKNKYFEPRSCEVIVIGSGLASFDTIKVNQEAAPMPAFTDETVYGIYGPKTSSLNYTYIKYEDQTSLMVGSSTISFRIQNINKELFLTLSGIPKSITVGDKFTLDVLQNYIPTGDDHLALEAQVMKVEDEMAWIYCVEEELGFIIKR